MFRKVVATLVLLACSMTAFIVGTGPAVALPRGTKVETYQGNLQFPVDMAWVKGSKKIFFTEKNSGKIRIMQGKNLLSEPCVDLSVSSEGERGALGLILDPKFQQNHFLYVYYTNSSPLDNRVARFKVTNNKCRHKNVLLKGLNASSSGYHNGGQLEFVHGKLFVSTGEAHSPSNAQDKNSRLGKILRITRNGRVPKGNPFNNPVWSYGHRNPFGLAVRPGTDKLYETENGPNCDDEMNLIKKGRNYGWGSGYRCGTAGVGTNPKGPEVRWSRIIVPTDPFWYTGKIRKLNGLVMGDYANGRLHKFRMNSRGTEVRKDDIVYNGGSAILDVSVGPGKWLYFLTPGSIMRVVKS